jgi:hypothetical protein
MFDCTGRSLTVWAASAALAVLVQSLAMPAAARASEAGPAVVSTEAAAERYGALPVRFEPNVGQFDEAVEFVARGGGYTLFLTPGEAVLSVRRAAPAPDLSQRRKGAKAQRQEVVRTRLVGSSVRSAGEGVDELPGVTNYFRGNDPARWRTEIVSYGAVRYGGVYAGVDMVYYGNGNELEYDFVVAPGADPSAIRMQIEGAERMTVDEAGDLVMEVAGGELRQRAPAIYQEGPAGRERVSGGYAVDGDVVSFSVGAYDPTRPLVLDPVIGYSRALDGGSLDAVEAIAVGTDGSAYVVGYTASTSFPTASPIQASHAGGFYDAFVTKLSPSGSALTYSTYLGGSGTDQGVGIAVGADGSAYVTGYTSSQNFPTAAPFQASHGGGFHDAFAAKLSPSGASLVYSTYLGGGNDDVGISVAVGADGSAYVTGWTSSQNFPTAAPFQANLHGTLDAFVTKLNPAGSALSYSTYVGGSGEDFSDGIAVGSDGSAYLTGTTGSTNFPTAAPFQANRSSEVDAFVTRVAPSGTALVYSTYLGGNSHEQARAIAVGSDGAAYVTGYTLSTNFPTAAPLQANMVGNSDAFITKLSASGAALVYSTYFGGDSGEEGMAIAVGADGSAHVAGWTGSSDFPTAAPIQATIGGSGDAFVTKLSASGSALTYSTYLGADLFETARGIAVGADGSAYVAGVTVYEIDFEFYDDDAVVTKINPATATTPGVYIPSTGAWFLHNENAAGAADLVFTYGPGGLAVPLVGDWDGDGDDTPGIYFRSTGAFFLRNASSGGGADLAFTFGPSGAAFVPLAGDWDGDGDDTVGLYDPATGAFFLRNTNAPGPADLVFAYGAAGAGLAAVTGDWDGDGVDTVGLYDPATGAFFLRNANTPGAADLVFTFGAGGQGFVPLAGDWDGDGRHTVGLAAPATGAFFLRNANAPGAADLAFSYGPPGATPLAGDWDGL